MESSKMNPVWKCSICGHRIVMEGKLTGNVSIACNHCGHHHRFESFGELVAYEERCELQLHPVVSNNDRIKELARGIIHSSLLH